MFVAADPPSDDPVEVDFGVLLALWRADLQSVFVAPVCVVALPLKSHD